jgi:aspartate kinase
MKVMKFGGTSVGKPERMHSVARLITRDEDPKIVVLSALSGTTNALVAIGESLAAGNREQAKQHIDSLEAHYQQFIKELLKTDAAYKRAGAIVAEHFEFLNIILKISYSDALNKDILAQGELLSTKLFSCYLSEINVDHALLPALEFMSIDNNDEPQLPSIRTKTNASLLPRVIFAATPAEKWIT